jgi:signal peptidase
MRRRLALLPAGLTAVAAMIVVAVAALPLVTPLRTQVVTSGSMEPSIPVGALIVTAPLPGVADPGDVILFPHPWGTATVVHRVVAVEHGAVDSDYITKGDANQNEDGWRISVGAVNGRVVATVPYLGYAVGTLHLPQARFGVALLVLSFVWPTILAAVRPLRRLAPRAPAPRPTL